MSETVVVVQGDGSVAVTTPATQVVTVQAQGPQGPPGPLGPFLGHVWVAGQPEPSEVVLRLEPGETIQVGANLSNWVVVAGVAATGSPVVEVLLENTVYGTMTWAPGDTVPTLATTGGAAQVHGPTDALSIRFPAAPDATLADITIRVYATRV